MLFVFIEHSDQLQNIVLHIGSPNPSMMVKGRALAYVQFMGFKESDMTEPACSQQIQVHDKIFFPLT